MAQTRDNGLPDFGASNGLDLGGFDPLGLDDLSLGESLDNFPAPKVDDVPIGFGGADFPVPKLDVGAQTKPPSARIVNSAAQVPTFGGSKVREPIVAPPKMPRAEPMAAVSHFNNNTFQQFDQVTGQAQNAYPMPKSDALPSVKARDAYPSPKGDALLSARGDAFPVEKPGADAFPAFKMPNTDTPFRNNTANFKESVGAPDFMGGLGSGDQRQPVGRSATVAFDRFISDSDMNAPKAVDAAGVPIVHKPTFDRPSRSLDDLLSAQDPLQNNVPDATAQGIAAPKIRLSGGRKEDYDIDNDSGLPLNDDPLGMMGSPFDPAERSGLKLDFPTNLEATRMGERHEHSGLLSVGRIKSQDAPTPVPLVGQSRTPSQVMDELSLGRASDPRLSKPTLVSGLINFSELAKERNHEKADMLGLMGSIENGQLEDKSQRKSASADDSQNGAVTETTDDADSDATEQPAVGGGDDEMTFDLSSIKIEKDNTVLVKQKIAENNAKTQEKKKRNVKRIAIIAGVVLLLLIVVGALVTISFIAKQPVDDKDLAPIQVIKLVEMTETQLAKDSLRDYRAFFQTAVQNNDAIDMTPEKRLDNQGMVLVSTVFGAARFQKELDDQLAMIESSVAQLESKDMCKGGWCALGLWSWFVYKEDAEHAEKYAQILNAQTSIASQSQIQNIVRAIVERRKLDGKPANYHAYIEVQSKVRELLQDVSGWALADYLYAEACVKMGDLEEANKRLAAYADKTEDVSYAGVTMTQAEIDYLLSNYEKANTLAQKVIDLNTGETQQIIRANTLLLRTKAVLSDWATFAHDVLEDKLKTYANQPVLLATVADICIQKGHADQCRILYQALIDGDSENTDVRQQHARLYVYAIGVRNLYLSNDLYKNEINDLSKAIDVAIKMNTGDILLWIYRALAEYAEKNYKMALEAAIEAERDVNYEWVKNYAPLIQKKSDGEEDPFATFNYDEIAENAYENVDFYIVGELYNNQRKYAEALRWMKVALKLYPQDARLWEVALNAAIELKDKEMVDKSIEALRTQRAMTTYHQYRVARFINDSGDHDEALKRMSVIVSQEQTNPEYLFYIGQLYFDRGNYDSAIQYFEKTIEYDSSNPESYFFAGRCYYELKRYPTALSSFSEARNKAETNPTYALWIGHAQKVQGMTDEALRSYSSVIDARAPMGKIPKTMTVEESTELAQAYQERALLNSARQRRKEAQNDFAQAEKLAPENMQFVREYVVFLFETGNVKEALKRIKLLEQKNEMDATRYYVKGLSYLQLGQRDQALSALETARDKGFANLEQTGIAGLRDSAEIYERLGYMYRDIGRKREAANMLTQYLEKARFLSDGAKREIQNELNSL